MSLSVNVLTPAGRRQILKVTPNTSILQILEDVCKKQGFCSADYDLKHYNTRLDLSSTVRFSNLPNNAQLELVGAVTSKTETDVLIILQLPSGERFMSEFPTTNSLWELLLYWQNEKGKNLLQILDESGNIMEPVCIYIRREVVGEHSLKATTLRSLGLTSGKAILRLNYRVANKPVQQAHVEALVIPRPKDKSSVKSDIPEGYLGPAVQSEEVWDNDAFNSEALWKQSSSCHDAEMHSENKNDNELNEINIVWVPSSDHLWGKGQTLSEPLTGSGYVDKHPQDNVADPMAIIDGTQLDDGARKRPAESVLGLEEQLIYLDNKGSLLYHLDEGHKQPFNDSLPDEFFAITLDDVRLLLSDLSRQRKELENIPLQTQALREAAYLSRLNKYPKAVIRVNFPDRFVLQGSFKAIDRVEKILNFVRSFLEDDSLDFHIYTTPPKNILKPEQRLFEVALVPTAVVHFACNMAKEHYLQQSVMEKISTLSAANRSCMLVRSSDELHLSKSECDCERKLSKIECVTNINSSEAISLEQPSTSRSSQQYNPSTGAVPKWFRTGKK